MPKLPKSSRTRSSSSHESSNSREQIKLLEAELDAERDRARSRDLARVAITQLHVDPERALLIALEACSRAVTYEARDALQQAVAASRIRAVFGGDGVRIQRAFFSHDGKRIITEGDDGMLRWWDIASQKEIGKLPVAMKQFHALHLSTQRDRALITTFDRDTHSYESKVIDLVNQRTLSTLAMADDMGIESTFFNDDGSLVVMGYESNIAVWNADTGERLSHVMIEGNCLGVSHDGRKALVYTYDDTAIILDLLSGQTLTQLDLPPDTHGGPDLEKGANHFSPDGKRVTSGRSNRLVYVWDVETGKLIHTLGKREVEHSVTAQFSPSGKYIIAQFNDSATAEVWDADTGTWLCSPPDSSGSDSPLRFLRTAPTAHEYAVISFSAVQYGSRVIQVSETRIDTGQIIRHFTFISQPQPQTNILPDGRIEYSPGGTPQFDLSLDGNQVLSLFDGVVRLYARVEPDEVKLHIEEYNPNRLYSADRSISINRLIDRTTNLVIADLGQHHRVVFSPDGRFLVTTGYTDPSIILRSAQSGTILWTINAYDRPITILQFMHDPHDRELLLVGSHDKTVRLWSLNDGREVARATLDAPDGPSYEAAISPDGARFAFVSFGKIHLWHSTTNELLSAATTLFARDLRFSADGEWLMAVDEDCARIWDATTLQPVSEFRLHFASVLRGDLAPDRSVAASYGVDGYVRLWEPLTGKEITQWRLPNEYHGPHEVLRFSKDGTRLYMNWQPPMLVHLEELIALAKSRTTRSLTDDERRQFIEQRMIVDP